MTANGKEIIRRTKPPPQPNIVGAKRVKRASSRRARFLLGSRSCIVASIDRRENKRQQSDELQISKRQTALKQTALARCARRRARALQTEWNGTNRAQHKQQEKQETMQRSKLAAVAQARVPARRKQTSKREIFSVRANKRLRGGVGVRASSSQTLQKGTTYTHIRTVQRQHARDRERGRKYRGERAASHRHDAQNTKQTKTTTNAASRCSAQNASRHCVVDFFDKTTTETTVYRARLVQQKESAEQRHDALQQIVVRHSLVAELERSRYTHTTE